METVAMVAFMADFCSVVMNQVSFALQKSATRDEEASEVKVKKSAFCSAKGFCGIVLLVVAALLHIAALAHADLTLLSCNASTGIIANVVIATRFLGERFDPRFDLYGLSLIGVGCTAIVLLSNKEKQELNLEQLISLLTKTQSICYLCLVAIVVNSAKFATPILLAKLRKFEKDCAKWDSRSKNRILPKSDSSERPEHLLIALLNDMTSADLQEVSPDSLDLKKWIKVPLLLFVTGAAMLASVSDLQFKLLGTIVEEAKELPDYMCLLPLGIGIAYSASQTLVYLNQAMKYYEQMEVMPIYQTMIMVSSIAVGMACFNEIRFYTLQALGGIALATAVCIGGIGFLLQKSKAKKQ